MVFGDLHRGSRGDPDASPAARQRSRRSVRAVLLGLWAFVHLSFITGRDRGCPWPTVRVLQRGHEHQACPISPGIRPVGSTSTSPGPGGPGNWSAARRWLCWSVWPSATGSAELTRRLRRPLPPRPRPGPPRRSPASLRRDTRPVLGLGAVRLRRPCRHPPGPNPPPDQGRVASRILRPARSSSRTTVSGTRRRPASR